MTDPGSNPSSDQPRRPLGERVEDLMPAVYDELRRIAATILRGEGPMTIQPTALVHEAFMKMASEHSSRWVEDAQVRAMAALAMRRILIDHVRERRTDKRGGGRRGISLDVSLIATPSTCDAVMLDEALTGLEVEHPRVAQLVVYRFFGDMSVEAAAERLGVSVSTAESDWRFGRAWLKRRLAGGAA